MVDNEPTPNADQQNACDTSPVPPTNTVEQNEEPDSKDDNSPQKDYPMSDSPKWTDIAIVFLTCVIAGAAIFQWMEMHDAGTQTDRIIAADERVAAAMEGSVGQAKAAFVAANKQAMVTQRAWVSVKVATYAPPLANGMPSTGFVVGQNFDIRVTVRNTGRTPALNVRTVTAKQGIEKNNGTFMRPNVNYLNGSFVTAGNITPDGETFSDFVAPFTAEDLDRIMSDKVRIFVHGRVEYDDVFGIHHWTDFCQFLLGGGAYAICPYHNGIDNNQPN
jgi:hypothetical protein